jgi:hypothetical protein
MIYFVSSYLSDLYMLVHFNLSVFVLVILKICI